jgi:hypothetical protein
MASLDSLPPDQRAVLQLVLGRGRGYDDIARMLSIDRAGVRDRALAALDALGPSTQISSERRHLITDYLLDQLPSKVNDTVRDRLARSASERAWARVVASELAPLASGPLPEIPVESTRREPAREPRPARKRTAARAPEPAAGDVAARERKPTKIPSERGLREPAAGRRPRSSRLGGAILLAVGALVVIGVAVFFVVNSGSSNKRNASSPAPSGTTSANSTPSGTTATPVAQINLLSPSGSKTTAGIAEVLRRGNTRAIAIVGQGLPANTKHDAYAVWLYNSASDALRLGFVNPGVSSNGHLETAGGLPADAARYRQLLVTLETTADPRSPGKIVLQGTLTGVS